MTDEGNTELDVDALADRPRREILEKLEEAINESYRKATKGRVRDAEAERVRQGWVRSLANLVSAYRLLRNDVELEDMGRELEELKGRNEDGDGPQQTVKPGPGEYR